MSTIDAMAAGRELDALVAERVMGWTVNRRDGGHWQVERRPGQWNCLHNWEASLDIAAAWQVVEHIRRKLFDVEIIGAEGEWAVRITDTDHDGNEHLMAEQCEQTAPLAICKAGLQAVSP